MTHVPVPPHTIGRPRALELVVAINPTAAFGAHADVGSRVVAAYRSLGHSVTGLTAESLLTLEADTRRALLATPDALVVVGGDGMANLGTTLVAETPIALGIIACGTGNDLARGLGLPINDIDAAVEASLRALEVGPRVIDAVTVRTADGARHWFAGVLSAGFDAAVNERANRMRYPRGRSRYVLALLIELAGLRPHSYRLVLDGEVVEVDALLVSVGNNVSIGGGMRVTPHALLDDGLLDVMLVRPLSRFAFLRIFPRVFAGTHLSDPRVTVLRASRVQIQADAAIVAYADGERMGALPADIEVRIGALRVLAPVRRAEA